MPRRSKNKALASSSRSMCDRWEVGRIVSGWRPTHREAILWRVCSRGVQASAFYCKDHLNVPNVFCLWFGFYPASSTMMVMPASHLPQRIMSQFIALSSEQGNITEALMTLGGSSGQEGYLIQLYPNHCKQKRTSQDWEKASYTFLNIPPPFLI